MCAGTTKEQTQPAVVEKKPEKHITPMAVQLDGGYCDIYAKIWSINRFLLDICLVSVFTQNIFKLV